jgi:hypothetical protein
MPIRLLKQCQVTAAEGASLLEQFGAFFKLEQQINHLYISCVNFWSQAVQQLQTTLLKVNLIC